VIFLGSKRLRDWRIKKLTDKKAIDQSMQPESEAVSLVDRRSQVGWGLATAHKRVCEPSNEQISWPNVITWQGLEMLTGDVAFFAPQKLADPNIAKTHYCKSRLTNIVLCFELAPERSITHGTVFYSSNTPKL
jgi:hypothetical protein